MQEEDTTTEEVTSASKCLRIREWMVFGIFVLAAALFYAPLLLGMRAFPDGDFVHHFFPFSLYQHQALAAGRLAIWNPFTYGGHPFLADVQAAIFYPISNLVSLLTLPITDEAARFYWLQVEVVLQTALAGWFAYLWLRDLTGSRWGGLIGGVTFAFSGYVTGYAPLQLAVLRTTIWLPLLLWTLGSGWQEPRRWRWWLGSIGALGAALLAGHSQSFLFLAYATAAWVLCLIVVTRPLRIASIVGAWLVVVATIALTAAQWMPSLEFVQYSVRASVDYTFVSGGLALADFWQLLLPTVLTQYSPLYIGVVGVVLAVVAFFSYAARQSDVNGTTQTLLPMRAGILFCLGLAIFASLASLGGNGPLYPLLYRIAPGWSWFRGQERAAFLVVLGLSGLAAFGMAALASLSPQARRRAGIVAGALVVAVVYAFGLLWQLQGRSAVEHAEYLLIAGVTLILGLSVAVMVSLPGWSARRSGWIVALAFVNLLWANASTNQLPGAPADRVRIAPEISAVSAAVAADPTATNGLPARVYNEFRAYDDYGMRAQVEDVWGSSPLRVERYSALFEQFPLDRMWRLLGVEYVLTWRRELFGPSDLLAEFPQATDTTYLHRLPETNTRAWFAPEVMIADDEVALGLLADHEFDLDQQGLLGPENDSFAEVSNAIAGSAIVTMTRQSPESYRVTAQNDQDGLLLVAETWLPGWVVANVNCGTATCPETDGDGRPYFLPMRADLALVGVWLPGGNSTFDLRYDPLTVRLGMWISGITLLILLLVVLWHGWRRMRLAQA